MTRPRVAAEGSDEKTAYARWVNDPTGSAPLKLER